MITKYLNNSIIALSSFAAVVSCTPETIEEGPITQESVDASFTVSKTGENKYFLKRNYNNYINSQWNIDDAGYNNGKSEENLFLPDAGTYIIKHRAVGIGGMIGGEASQTLVVPTSDPVAGNMIKGGRFDTADEAAQWSIHKISASGAQWVIGNNTGVATLVASGSNQQAIYQAVNVEAGKSYSINMVVSSETPLVDTWFEVYVLNSIPASGQDLSGSVYRNINTWDGCGTSKFGGKISSVGCNSSKNAGVYTATATGTVYLVIKSGGKTINGLKVDNVEFRRMQ